MKQSFIKEKILKLGRLKVFIQLMRIDKPVGFFLLLWPTLWGLWLAERGSPNNKTLIIFILSVFFIRSAGCVINDFFDRNIDEFVKRTSLRPLPKHAIEEIYVKLLFVILISISFALVLTFNIITVIFSFAGLSLILIYPLMKRHIYFPQLILGVAFSLSIPMTFTAIKYSIHFPITFWMLFLANISWTIAYDTQYSMVDRDDDIKIGVKSTAILFGRFDKIIIGFLQMLTLLLLGLIGWKEKLNNIFYFYLIGALILFIWQFFLIKDRLREKCFQAFINNQYVGMLIFIGIIKGI